LYLRQSTQEHALALTASRVFGTDPVTITACQGRTSFRMRHESESRMVRNTVEPALDCSALHVAG
jgi:hypothetical protein